LAWNDWDWPQKSTDRRISTADPERGWYSRNLMEPQGIKVLREHLTLTQEVFARILGVSFATVNRWENGKTVPTGDYARVLQTLQRLTVSDGPGATIDWKRVGALSAMAAVAGFSPLLTLGAALAPVLITHLPSWADVPFGGTSRGKSLQRSQRKLPAGKPAVLPLFSPPPAGKRTGKGEVRHTRAGTSPRTHTQPRGA
jgi:DNA-binding transcriptional regulator YiaG